MWLTLHNPDAAKEVLDAQQRAYDGNGRPAPVADPYQQAMEFTIAHYEWRHAEVPDDLLTGVNDG